VARRAALRPAHSHGHSIDPEEITWLCVPLLYEIQQQQQQESAKMNIGLSTAESEKQRSGYNQ
jgi:hypothetical protein